MDTPLDRDEEEADVAAETRRKQSVRNQATKEEDVEIIRLFRGTNAGATPSGKNAH